MQSLVHNMTQALDTRVTMPKHKDRIDFYPCVTDAALDTSDFTRHKFVEEIFFAL